MPLTKTDRSPQRRNHAPTQGRNASAWVSRLDGARLEPVFDLAIMKLSHWAHVTIGAVVDGEDHVLDFGGGNTFTVAANSSSTVQSVAEALIQLIDDSTAIDLVAGGGRALSGGGYRFWVSGDATFTPANTGSSTPANTAVTAVTDSSSTGGASGTSITVAALQGAINAGQYLTFYDAVTGEEQMCELTANVAANPDGNSSTLTVRALNEAINTGGVATHPAEMHDLTSTSVDQQYEFSSYITNSSGGQTDGVATGSTTTASLPGNKFFKDGAKATAIKAAQDGKEIYLFVFDPVPQTGWEPEHVKGAATVTARSRAADVSSFVTNDFSVQFVGDVTYVDAVKAA